MKKLLLIVFMGLLTIAVAQAAAPVMNSPQISPVTAGTGADLLGYCNGTDADGDNITYFYEWFRNNVTMYSGSFTNNTAGNPVPVGSYNDSDGAYSLDGASDVVVSGDYAYTVSYTDDTLAVWNISGHGNPIPLGTYTNSEGAYSLDAAYALAVSGDYIYTVSYMDDTLAVWDISSHGNPVPVGTYTNSNGANSLEIPTGVVVSGDYAYTISYADDTLSVWDISGHGNPVPVGSYNDSEGDYSLDGVYAMAISGDYVYTVSYTDATLAVWDISSHSDPVPIGSYNDSEGDYSLDGVYGIAVQGDYVYTVSAIDDTLAVWDISGHGNPVPVGTYTDNEGVYSLDGAWDVVVSDDYVYTVSYTDDTLAVWNISGHGNPIPLGTYTDSAGANSLDEAYAVAVSGDYVYTVSSLDDTLAVWDIGKGFLESTEQLVNTLPSSYTSKGEDWLLSCQAYDGTEYSSWLNSSDLTIFDTPPLIQGARINPTIAYTNDTLFGYCNASDADGDNITYFYEWFRDNVTMYSGSFTNTTVGNPVPVGSYNDSEGDYSLAGVYSVAVSGDYAYTVSSVYDNLVVWNISSHGNPFPVGTYTSASGNDTLDAVYSVAVSGDYAYTTSYLDDTLVVWNISSHGNPIPVGSYNDSEGANSLDGAYSVAVSGDYAYTVSYNDDTLSVWNISSHGNPVPVGSYTDSEGDYSLDGARDVVVSGDYAYTVSYNGDTLSVWDISGHGNPVPIGTYTDSEGDYSLDEVRSVAVSGDYAYTVSYADHTLSVWNISGHGNPVPVGTYTDFESDYSLAMAWDVAVSGDYAYTTSFFDDTLSVWDISGHGNPVPVGSYNDSEGANSLDMVRGVAVSGDYAYTVSYADDTLAVWDIGNGFIEDTEQLVNTLPSSYTESQDEWTFSCQAYDGGGYSIWVNSSTLTISNTPPTFNTSNFTYLQPHTSNLSLTINASDMDGDTITYSINDTGFTINSSTGIINKTNSVESTGTYNVTVNITDSTDWVTMWVLFNITNTAPTAPSSVNITPTTPHDLRDLTCTWIIGADADNDIIYNETTWYNGTTNVTSVFNNTVLGYGNTTEGDTWTCSVRHFDKIDHSAWVNSSSVQINYNPDILGSRISPTIAYTNDTLLGYCNASDADGDNVAYYYKWYLNGTVNETGVSNYSSSCYQEFANVSTSCGGLNTGNYTYVGGGTNPANIYDGNWGSYGNVEEIYINYSKPLTAISSSLWQVKDGGSTQVNLTIPSSCWSYDSNSLFFKIKMDIGPPNSWGNWSCYNGTEYELLRAGNMLVYEEAMWWYLEHPEGVEQNVANISQALTSKGDNWTLSCSAYDGSTNSSWMNSSTLTISNSAPTTPSSLTPISGAISSSTTVNCTGSTDLDNDPLYYTIYSNRTGSWSPLVVNDADGLYVWDISDYKEQQNVDLRCVANDTFSSSSTHNPSGDLNLDSQSPRLVSNSSNYTSSIYVGDTISFSSAWSDDYLDNVYFEFYNGTHWSNTTNSSPVNNQSWTISRTITAIRDMTINWSWYADDTFGQTNQSVYDNFVILNTAPSFTESNFTYVISHTLNLSLQMNVTDIDGDTITYSINDTGFTINSSTGLINKTNSISSTGVYNVTVNASDTDTTWSWIFFNITNTAPTVTQPSVNDTVPYITNLVNCSAGIFNDPDGDSKGGIEYRWYNGTVLISGQTSSSIDLDVASLNKSDIIKCSIRVNDTQAWSSWVNSSNTATIQDSLPIDPTSASISATQYVGTDIEFNCSGSTDVDNDAITYHVQFYNSNATTILQNYSSVTNYTVQTSDAHDSIRIRCKATTAVANSTGYYEASKIINDSLPTTPTTISLTSTIKVTETLEANCSGATDSDSDAITYSYQFYNTNASSILQDYSVTNTYTVLSTDAHDQIRVRCNATTTYISSSYKEENKSVLNTKPTQTSLLYPNDLQILTDNATVYLNWSTSIDVDGDTITYYVYLENNTPPSFNQSVSDSNLTLLTLMDDSYSWYVIAGDYNENNTNPGTISFTVDTSALNVTYTSPTPTHLERQINNYLYINVTVNHPSVNVDTCTLEWQGTNETMTMVGAGTSVYCYKNKTTVDGTEYIFTVFANNTASYIGTAGKRNNTENTIPSITSSDVTPAAPNRTSTLTCSPSGFLDDEADTAYYYYIWFNSTSRVAGQNTSTYDCSANGCNKTDIMTCQVTPFDDYENGTSFNSSETIENSQPTSPSSVYNLGEHLVDHTPEVNWTSGTDVDGDTIYTVVYVGINNTPTSPDGNETGSSYNLTFSLIDGTTYYYRARSYDGTSYSEYSSADEFRMNSLPSITIVAPNSTISFTSGNSTSLNYSAIDAEGDPIVYSIYDNSSSLLYSGIAKSTSYAYTYDGVYDWVVNVSDTYEVGTQPANFTVAIPPKLSNASLSATSGVNDAAFIIYINASDNTKLEWVKVNITDPNGFIANSSGVFMSPGNVDGQQNYTYSPSTDGIYTFHFFAMDINGNPVNFSSSLTYSESTSASPPSGGGGGGSKIVEVALTGNITAFCGDGICQDGENPFSCSSDCKVNFDTLITCLWDSEIECNWEQSWFPFVLLFGLISVGLYSFYSLQVVKK